MSISYGVTKASSYFTRNEHNSEVKQQEGQGMKENFIHSYTIYALIQKLKQENSLLKQNSNQHELTHTEIKMLL